MKAYQIKDWYDGIKDRTNKRFVLPFLKRMSESIRRGIDKRVEGYVSIEWKQKAIDDFKLWLADFPDNTPVTQTATMDSCDMYTLLSEFTALRNEIKLQNREQNKSIETFTTLMETFQQSLEMFKDRSDGIALLEDRIRTVSEKDSEKRTALPFLDMRDALMRGLEASKNIAKARSFLKPRGIEGTIEGYELAIRRFDRALSNVSIVPIKTVGHKFDPKMMRAINARSVEGVEKGIVVEEVLSGFILNGEILRVAEVIVNK